MTKINIKAILSITTLLAFVIILVVAYNDKKADDAILKNKGEYTVATVTKKVRTYRAKVYVHYSFNVDNKSFSGSRLYYTSEGEVNVGDNFEVVYYPKNPEINRILFDRKK